MTSPNSSVRGWTGFLAQTEIDDAVIRAIASPRQQVVNQGQVYSDYGGQIGMTLPNVSTRIVSDLGVMIGTLAFVPAMDVVRQALPMVLSLLKMAIVICLPLVLVVGTYDLKTVSRSAASNSRCSSRTSGFSSRAGSTARS